jgi:hypothetical protein
MRGDICPQMRPRGDLPLGEERGQSGGAVTRRRSIVSLCFNTSVVGQRRFFVRQIDQSADQTASVVATGQTPSQAVCRRHHGEDLRASARVCAARISSATLGIALAGDTCPVMVQSDVPSVAPDDELLAAALGNWRGVGQCWGPFVVPAPSEAQRPQRAMCQD